MQATTQGFIEVNGRQIYCETAGSGHPLVLLHAGINDSRMWDDQWDAFARQYRVVRYDRPGFGQSPVSGSSDTSRRDLSALLDQLGIERAHLIGCSMGGMLAIDFTLEHPERVSALVSVAGMISGVEMEGEMPEAAMRMLAAFKAGELESAACWAGQSWLSGEDRPLEQMDDTLRRRAHEMALLVLANHMIMRADEQFVPPAANRLAEIHVPTLAITGSFDDPVAHEMAQRLRQSISGARWLDMEGTAHFPNMEQPDAFNRTVLEFLAGV